MNDADAEEVVTLSALGVAGADSYLSSDELDAISRLASDRAAPAGIRLARLTAGLLDATLGERERLFVCDVLLRVVCKAQKDLRQAVSRRLAPNPNAPRDLIAFLANDDIAVARPVLLESEVLTDLDLVNIVGRRSVFHGRSIATRRTLSETVGESLVARGDHQSMAFLLQNAGADISLAAALSLAKAARSASNLQELLLRRLSPEMARELYWHVSGELRRDIRSRFELGPDGSDRLAADADPRPRLAYVDGAWVVD